MVEKCANPNCEVAFRYSSSGRLFAFEVRSPGAPCKDVPQAICERHPSHATVCFWLCEQCCHDYTLSFSIDKGVHLVERVISEEVHEMQGAKKIYPPLAAVSYDRDVLPGVPL